MDDIPNDYQYDSDGIIYESPKEAKNIDERDESDDDEDKENAPPVSNDGDDNESSEYSSSQVVICNFLI